MSEEKDERGGRRRRSEICALCRFKYSKRQRNRCVFVFLHIKHRKPSCALVSERAERMGVERREEQEVDGKVIAVSTWSTA